MKKSWMRMLGLVCCLISCVSFSFGAVAEGNLSDWQEEALEPYMVSFDDYIAIRLLNDGSIDATVEEYEQAEWDNFLEEGDSWAIHYTEDEYRERMDEYDSINCFEAMQASKDYVDVGAQAYGALAAVHADGTVSFNKRAEGRYRTDSDNSKWRNIEDIALGSYTIVALRKDGTIVTDVLSDTYSFTKGVNPKQWKNVKAIENDFIAVGLREDGKVYYAAMKCHEEEEGYIPLSTISDWSDIVQVDTSWDTVVGLKSDGTVVFAGDNEDGKSDTSSWTDIAKVAVGGLNYVVGLKKDGTLVATVPWALDSADGLADGRTLNNVVDVYANRHYVLAILSDGTTRLLGQGPIWSFEDGAWAAGEWEFDVTHIAKADATSTVVSVKFSNDDAWTCHSCSAQGQEFAFCTSCGAAKLQIKKCASCGWETENMDFNFCGQCGGSLSK